MSPGLEAARHALNAGHKLFLVLDASAEDVLDAFDVCHSGQKAKLLLACHELPYHEQQPPSYAHLVKIQPMHYSSLARQMYLRWLTGSRDVVELPEPQVCAWPSSFLARFFVVFERDEIFQFIKMCPCELGMSSVSKPLMMQPASFAA